MLTALLVLLQAAGPAAPPPSERAVALGRQVAETGTLGSLLPMIEAKEIDELVAAHPELSSPEQAALRATAHRVARAGVERLFEAEARAYAGAMTEGELRAVVGWQTGPAARALRRAQPAAIAAAVAAMAGTDFKKDALAAFCRNTGKGCAPAK